MPTVDFYYSYGASWRAQGGGTWTPVFVNNTGGVIHIKSFSLNLGTGNTGGSQIWGNTGLTGPYAGNPIHLQATINDGPPSEQIVTNQVSMESQGTSTSDTGYFGGNYTSYTFEYTTPVAVQPGASVNLNLTVMTAGGAAVLQRNMGDAGTTLITVTYDLPINTTPSPFGTGT